MFGPRLFSADLVSLVRGADFLPDFMPRLLDKRAAFRFICVVYSARTVPPSGSIPRTRSGFVKARSKSGPAGSPAVLFSALFFLVEGSSALALAAGEAMFVSGVGVDGVPVAYVALLFVMLAAMGAASWAQAKFPMERVMAGLFKVFLAFASALSLYFAAFPSGGPWDFAMLYALKLGSAVWMYAAFSLYWNFADEHFGVREGKRLYPVFSAFGCLGAVAGAGAVFSFSEYLGVPAGALLWFWAASIALALPLSARISRCCPKSDSGAALDAASAGVFRIFSDNVRAVSKSRYVRAILLMYVAVIAASAIMEYSALYAFSEWSSGGEDGGQAALASLFGALGVAVNAFNIVVNLFVFGAAVSRIGVRNMALLQPLLFMAGFVWLYASFGFAAAVFAFFLYRGTLESVDANNENLMISVMPGRVRQQVRLAVESLVVPLATAAAGAFLMAFAHGQDGGAPRISALFPGVSGLSQKGVAAAGFACAAAGLFFAFRARGAYTAALAGNLRSAWVDFSEPFEDMCARRSGEPIPDEFFRAGSPSRMRAFEAEAACRPLSAVRRLADAAGTFGAGDVARAADILDGALARCGASAPEAAGAFAAASAVVPEMAAVLVRRGALGAGAFAHASALAASGGGNACAHENAIPGGEPPPVCAAELSRRFGDRDAQVRLVALRAFSKIAGAGHFALAPEIARLFGDSGRDARAACLECLGRIGSPDCIAPLFGGVGGLSGPSGRAVLALLKSFGKPAVPQLFAVAGSPEFSYSARGICAQALAAAFPAQLEILSSEAADADLERAREFAGFEAALRGPGGNPLFARICGERKIEAAAFVIGLRSLSGSVPPADMVVPALLSKNRRERDNAAEALEQGMPRRELRAVLEILHGGPPARSGTRGALSRLAEGMARSPFDEEFFAACAGMLSPELARAVCGRLARQGQGPSRDALVEILDALARSASRSMEGRGLLAHERLDALARCPLFEGFEIRALFELALRASPRPGGGGEGRAVAVSRDGGWRFCSIGEAACGEAEAALSDIFEVAAEFPNAAAALFLRGGLREGAA